MGFLNVFLLLPTLGLGAGLAVLVVVGVVVAVARDARGRGLSRGHGPAAAVRAHRDGRPASVLRGRQQVQAGADHGGAGRRSAPLAARAKSQGAHTAKVRHTHL